MTLRRRARRGTVLPMLAVCLIGLFTFVGLAVDLGMLAVSRTECQNAADVGALVGARSLNNKPGVADSNRPQAIQDAKDAITGNGGTKTGNVHLSDKFIASQITTVQAGMYVYDPAATPAQFKADFVNTPAAGQSWTAMRVDITTSQPTYFMRVFGIQTMPSGAYAIAVHRPRDVAFALDMTGSMGFSSQFNGSGGGQNRSLNPDDLVPVFGHYVSTQANLRATANLYNGNQEAFPRSNFTVATPGGPPIVRNFYFDAANVATPTNLVRPIATKTVGGVIVPDVLNAFHRWNPPESGGNSTSYTPVTYDFTGYNAMHNGTEAIPKGPTPAPGSFGTMTDAGGNNYVGFRYRRADGSVNTTDATWSTGSSSTKAAGSLAELLGYTIASWTVSSVTEPWVFKGDGFGAPSDANRIARTREFRDPVWETYGYDLDITKYRVWKRDSNNGLPALPATYLGHPTGGNNIPGNIRVATADEFTGFSMGPGYWGKTMFVWPPDPRTPVGNPGDAGFVQGDWRQRFFYRTGTTPFNIQTDTAGPNQTLMRTAANNLTLNTGVSINYAAVLRWLKAAGTPQILPPNLRAGHVLYYSSIPNDVASAGGATEAGRDQIFWREYIDYVFANGYTSGGNLYGVGDSWAGAATSVTATNPSQWVGPDPLNPWPNNKPYMNYADSPNRPRLHFWFGPLSMMDYMQAIGNWLPGTCYEAQCWQLKAGMNAVLDDIRNNRPNDAAGLVLFSANHHNTIRVPMGQNFIALKNALFYPKQLLSTLDVPSPTVASVQAEYRPYNDNITAKSADQIPNAGGSTDPNTGLMYAYNLLSPSATLPTGTYGTVKGRRGASKIVVFETDGVPNTYRDAAFTQAGYNSYYSPGSSSGNIGNNNLAVLDATYPVVSKIVKTMADNTTDDSGLSLPNAPAKVYAIGFGDLFDTVLAPGATTSRTQAHAFLAKVAELGGTGPVGATTLSSDQIITGPYEDRIANLRSCMERIFQSGVSVTLIE